MPDPQVSIVRKPRGKVTANGKLIPYTRFEVIQNANHASDSYQVEMPLFDPAAPYDWAWWSDETDIEVEISLGFEQQDGSVNTWTSMIVGPVDAVAMAPLSYGHNQGGGQRPGSAAAKVGAGGMVAHEGGPAHPGGSVMTIRGRDYSGQLQDSAVSQQFAGGKITAKTIVPELVARVPHLTLDMPDTPASAGSMFHSEEGRLFIGKSAWDVIGAVADHEGYQTKVKGRTVQVKPQQAPDASNPYKVFFIAAIPGSANQAYQPMQSNCVTLRLARALNVGKGIDVFVQSYDAATGQRPSRKRASARSSRRAARHGSGQSQSAVTYTFNRHGMTPDQAQKHANAKAGQIAQFEREIEFQIEGDLSLTVDRAVELSGTRTQFDQVYFPDQISHRFAVETGYAMEVRARNKSADVAVTDGDTTGLEPA